MSGPIVGKRRLRAELRRLRRDRELTQDQVASDMEWSLSKLIRIENGTVAISVSDLRSLLSYYSVLDQPHIEDLLTLARAAKKRMWWDEWKSEVGPQLLAFTGFELEATQIYSYQPIFIPGLLQTERYARALFTGGETDDEPHRVERLTEFRMLRQRELFGRDDPPQFTVILDESALRRTPDRNWETMRDQLARLIEIGSRPFIDIHILPYDVGVHRGWDGNFTLMEFGDEDGVLYAQNNPTGVQLLWEEQDLVSEFRGIAQRMIERGLTHDASINFIRDLLDSMS